MPTFDVTFIRPIEKTYRVRAANQDEAIEVAREDLANNEEPENETSGDWECDGMEIVTEDSISKEDEDLIRNDMHKADLIYILNGMCGFTYNSNARHSDLAYDVLEQVRNGVVSMLAVRAIATQMKLHREAAIAKLTEDERCALGFVL
jgi:mannose-6-phosphate isomerase class I